MYTLFLFSTLFHLLFVFQGVDVTDTGWILNNQVNAFNAHVNVDRIIPKTFLTDFFGGMWLRILPGPNLLWSRIGGVFLCSLNTVIVFSILSVYFERKRTFIIVFISSLFVTMRSGIYPINYDSFPVFLLNVQVLLFHNLIMAPSHSRKADILSFLIGFMTIPIILSRLSLVLIFLSPLVMILSYVITGKKLYRALRTVVLSFSGFVCSTAFFGFLYWQLGLFDSGIINFFTEEILAITARGGHHDIRILSALYARHILIMATILGCLVFLLLILSRRFVSSSITKISIFFMPAAYAVVLMLSGLDIDQISHRIIAIAIGLIVIQEGLFFYLNKGESSRLMLLSIAGIMIMAVIPIGSNGGLFKAYKGMWLILPLSLLCTDQMKEWTRNKKLASLSSYNNTFLAMILVLSLFFHFTNIYRDDINRLHLTEPFSHPALAGIFSSPRRVSSIENFLTAMGRYADKDDTVLMVNDIPLFYYLTGTKPSMDQSWLYRYSLDIIKLKQHQLIKENRLPKLVIFAKVDTRGKGARSWTEISMECNEPDSEKLKYLKDEYIRKQKYVFLWQNRAFEIYGNPLEYQGCFHQNPE